jgi:xanthine dehydrogenase YagS FAD-binding subunit
MKYFDHLNATSIDEAISSLIKYEGKADIIAGGTDLLGVLKERILPDYPVAVINIKTIPEMGYISESNGGLRIGALTRLSDIADNSMIKNNFNILSEAALAIASPQVRNLGTIGGNLAQHSRCWYYRYSKKIGGPVICMRKDSHSPCLAVTGDNRYHAIIDVKKCVSVCASDMAVALAALGATIKITGQDGSRVVPVSDFYGVLGNDINYNEIITEIQVPPVNTGAKQKFLKYTIRKPIDFAVVSVASVLNISSNIIDDGSIYLGALSFRPVRAAKAEAIIRGKMLSESVTDSAINAELATATPLSNNSYKIQIAKSLLKKAILS